LSFFLDIGWLTPSFCENVPYCFVVFLVCGILVEVIVYLGNFAKGRDVTNVGVALH